MTVALDGSASGDTDGTISTYAWAFGDGQTATGPSPTASHTYAAGGDYTVTLTVTDDDGSTGQVAHVVTAVDPGAPVVVAQDGFGRTVSGGWGTADVGGAWSGAVPASGYSVAGGVGRMALPTAGVTRAVTLGTVSAADVDVTVDLTLDKAPTGSGTQMALVARKVGTSEYRLRVHQRTTNRTLQVTRVVSGAEAVVGMVTLPGGAYSPGQVLHLRFRIVGTTLTGKAWFDAATEPAAWQVQVTDSTRSSRARAASGCRPTSRALPPTHLWSCPPTTCEPSGPEVVGEGDPSAVGRRRGIMGTDATRLGA